MPFDFTSERIPASPSDAGSPWQQLAATALGVALFTAARRGPPGALFRLAGLGLIGYGARPMLERTIRRAAATRRHVQAHGSVDIDRSVQQVFTFFKDFECFPRVAGGLHSVVDYQDGLSHWEAYTPSGATVGWDVVITKYLPNSVIGWESVPTSGVFMRGLVRFTPLGPARTRLDVNIAYQPPQLRLSEAVRAMLTRRNRAVLAKMLDRVRFYLESLPRALPEDVDD